jgi:hypothetical protein
LLSTSLPSALIRVIWADGMENWQCQRKLDLARISVGMCHRSGDVGGELRFQGKLVSNEAHRLFGWPAPGRKRVLCGGKWGQRAVRTRWSGVGTVGFVRLYLWCAGQPMASNTATGSR